MKHIFNFIIGFGIGYWITAKLNTIRRIDNEVYQIILNSNNKDKIFQVLRKKPHLIKYLNQIVDNIYDFLKTKDINYFLEIEKNLFEDELTVKIKTEEMPSMELIEVEEEFFYKYYIKIFEHTSFDIGYRIEPY